MALKWNATVCHSDKSDIKFWGHILTMYIYFAVMIHY